MNKEKIVQSDLTTIISNELDLSKTDVDKVITCFLKQIEYNLMIGNPVMLTGFGKFSTYVRAEREFYNPLQKKKFRLPAVNRPSFKYSPVFVRRIGKQDGYTKRKK